VPYPGTYAHGGYNREITIMDGRLVLNDNLFNLPDWLVLKLRIEGEDATARQRRGALLPPDPRHPAGGGAARAPVPGPSRGETTLRSRRFVSMAHSHQAGIEWTLTPQNWSGRVEVPGGVPRRVGTCCIVDDGEAETGRLATSWHSTKFVDPRRDEAVLPILHLNGHKIAGPTVLARSSPRSWISRGRPRLRRPARVVVIDDGTPAVGLNMGLDGGISSAPRGSRCSATRRSTSRFSRRTAR
jgi:hypothetical protein